jgi:hypothetical protein
MEGPILLKIFSCKDCEHLKKASLGYSTKNPYSCYHNDIIMKKNGPQIMLGDIGKDKITPEFCPFIFKKTRLEKLKLLQNCEEDVKK